MLFVPGNNPGMLRDAHIYGSDALMFDLEDAVALAEKDAARLLVYNALKTISYQPCERVVRVNPLSTPYGRQDIEAMVCAGVDVIRLPKTDDARDVADAEQEISQAERKHGIPEGTVAMMAAIESARGIVNAPAIATASKRLVAVALGAEDYCANLKTSRSQEGTELFFARSSIVVAARAAGIDCIDTVFSDVNDEEQLVRETLLVRQLGFDGKSVINPRQITPVHKVFAPTQRDIEKALRVRAAMTQAQEKGSGVISLDGKMVDRPVLLRALRVLELARASNLWAEPEEE